MFFSEKVETVGGIKDFLKESPSKKKILSGALTGLTAGVFATTLQPSPEALPAMAMPILGTVTMADRIIKAFDPIIQLLQGMSYPVCFIMLTAGCLVIMTGNRAKGLNIIKWAAIGYLLMQFAPGIMAILVEVGRAMAN